MRYQVNSGVVKHEGVFYEKGSLFDADAKNVEHLVANGVVTVYADGQSAANDSSQGYDADTDIVGEDTDDLAIPELNAAELIVEAPKRTRK